MKLSVEGNHMLVVENNLLTEGNDVLVGGYIPIQ